MFRLQRLEITGFKSFADYTEIVFTDSGITAVVGPNGCGKCVSGDTLITLSNGQEIGIRELVETALENSFFKEKFDDGFQTQENPQNIEILSLNPKTLKLEPRKVSAFIKRRTTPKLLLIRTNSGREIKATPYHPLFTLEGGNLRALRADEIKTGVRIAIPRNLPSSEKKFKFSPKDYLNLFDLKDNVFIPFSDELKNWTNEGKNHFGSFSEWSKFAGVSETTLTGLRGKQAVNIANLNSLAENFNALPPFAYQVKSKGNGFIHLPENFSPELARFLGLLIAEGRNVSNNVIWFVNSDEAVNREFKRLAKKLFDIGVLQKNYKKTAIDNLIFSKSLCQILDKLFGFITDSNSFNKQIPPQVLQADAETKWSFISGLFEGDAYVCARPQKSNGKFLTYIEYTTASETLARQIVSLLLQLGVFAYLRPKQKYAANTQEKKIRTYYSVLIYGSQQLKYTAGNLSFIGEKQKSLEKLKNLNPSENPNNDLVPGAAKLVKEAVRLAKVKVKPNRRSFPKIAAYTSQICEPSRKGLNEVIEQIKYLSKNYAPAEDTLEQLNILANSDVYWDKVIQVEEISASDDWVYDLSIDETHNFVANNIIVHNSNVSDSFSWVLGEQRPKSLRGEEMKDVIFQGTSKRSASGMAEVVLHLVRDESSFDIDESELEGIDETLSEFDEQAVEIEEISPEETELKIQNSELKTQENGFHGEEIEVEKVQAAQVGSIQTIQVKKARRHWRPRSFALDFAPGEAVSVTRRLYLSGESEYLLNGKTCRLRDIQDLFAGTGLSGAHYAIIEQGRIGQILSAKPSDRRNLIEEAAGISKFRTRQRATEARLESAKGNLQRITDIVSEIEKQANSLRRQAAKTRRYKLLREELRVILRQVFAAEGRYLSDLVEDLDAKLVEAVKIERESFSKVVEKEDAFREATQKAREAEESLAEIRARHAENALQRDRADREHRYQEEQIANLKQRSAVLQGEIKATEQRLELIKTEFGRLAKEEKRERAEAEKAGLAFREAEKSYQSKLQELNRTEVELEAERAEFVQHTAAVERLAEIKRQLENTIERLKERAEGLRREGERAEETYAEHQREAEKLEKTLGKEREKLETLHAEKQEILQTIEQARTAWKTAENELKLVREEFSRKRNRLETLQELEEKRAVYAPSVQKLFAEQKKIGVSFLGTLADKLNVDDKAEKAVENLFGAFLQAVLVENEKEARKVVDYLNANNFGRIA
ncbi:MAG TPA: LAGLIDADG family homing endonuclease, partial [Pyrinomonadaceae bacterium]|nr:LAGLIDADG family homing endonuclease [Pyrinomonadaceae bacterium]